MLNPSTIRGTFKQIPYWKLRGRFHSCGYRDQEVAEYIGIGRDTMSGRMQGAQPVDKHGDHCNVRAAGYPAE